MMVVISVLPPLAAQAVCSVTLRPVLPPACNYFAAAALLCLYCAGYPPNPTGGGGGAVWGGPIHCRPTGGDVPGPLL